MILAADLILVAALAYIGARILQHLSASRCPQCRGRMVDLQARFCRGCGSTSAVGKPEARAREKQ